MHQSILDTTCFDVPFPAFTGERTYMQAIIPQMPLPSRLAAWQDTVDAMLTGIEAPLVYLMIDQTELKAGQPQRRPGLHVDGYWNASRGRHDSHGGGHIGWDKIDFSAPEATLLASNVVGARAFAGFYSDDPRNGGDCSHIDTSAMQEFTLFPYVCYAGNVAMLHESMPVSADCQRTLVRITVPGWSPS